MKLATLKDGTRDGQLAVVARDLKTVHFADGIASTLRAALDDWGFIAPQLQALSDDVNAGRARRAFDFDSARCMAPLPRAHQWVEGCAYPSHAQRLGSPVLDPDAPPLSQRAGDALLGPLDAIELAHEAWGIDFGAGLAAITGDVAAGATPDEAAQQIRLLTLVNAVTLRNVAARPVASFAPVAVTPDELGDAWRGAGIALPLRSFVNGHLAGQPGAGVDVALNLAQLLASLCRMQGAGAGAIVGTGPVSNRDAIAGFACIAERRAQEVADMGEAVTPWLRFGDTVRIEMLDAGGRSVFGAIDQAVQRRA